MSRIVVEDIPAKELKKLSLHETNLTKQSNSIFSKLYKDAYFSTKNKSVFNNGGKTVKWERAGKLSRNPKLFQGIPPENDDINWQIMQGCVEDCYVVSVLYGLRSNPGMLKSLFPPDQPLFGPDYNGKFVVRLWRDGEFINLTIDDNLPFDEHNNPIFSKVSDPNIFWVSLVEKGLAKLYGSYENLRYGFASETMVNLTGGFPFLHRYSDYNDHLFTTLERDKVKTGIYLTGSQSLPDSVDFYGLRPTHSYTILDVRTIIYSELFPEPIRMLKLRDPYGNTGFNGTFSKTSDIWLNIPDYLKQLLGYDTLGDNGTFWIEWEIFIKFFFVIEVCLIFPDESIPIQLLQGKWGTTNSGGDQNSKTYFNNPSFEFETTVPKTNVLISFRQKNYQLIGVPAYPTKFDIYEANEAKHVASSGDYISSRDISLIITLQEAKKYRIIPSTQFPGIRGPFLIRLLIFSVA